MRDHLLPNVKILELAKLLSLTLLELQDIHKLFTQIKGQFHRVVRDQCHSKMEDLALQHNTLKCDQHRMVLDQFWGTLKPSQGLAHTCQGSLMQTPICTSPLHRCRLVPTQTSTVTRATCSRVCHFNRRSEPLCNHTKWVAQLQPHKINSQGLLGSNHTSTSRHRHRVVPTAAGQAKQEAAWAT